MITSRYSSVNPPLGQRTILGPLNGRGNGITSARKEGMNRSRQVTMQWELLHPTTSSLQYLAESGLGRCNEERPLIVPGMLIDAPIAAYMVTFEPQYIELL